MRRCRRRGHGTRRRTAPGVHRPIPSAGSRRSGGLFSALCPSLRTITSSTISAVTRCSPPGWFRRCGRTRGLLAFRFWMSTSSRRLRRSHARWTHGRTARRHFELQRLPPAPRVKIATVASVCSISVPAFSRRPVSTSFSVSEVSSGSHHISSSSSSLSTTTRHLWRPHGA